MADEPCGRWRTSDHSYGYVKYRAQFPYKGESKMFISTVAEDVKRVFLNGKLVEEASNAKPQVEIALAKYAQPGTNTLEISYELFGVRTG